jgi:hypothetical protein
MAGQPGSAVHLSHLSAGRDINVHGGGNYTHQLPPINVELDMTADPLLRLSDDIAEVRSWLERRRVYLTEKLVPRRPSNAGIPDFTRMWLETRDFDADRATFDKRLAAHLRQCDDQLLRNVLAGLHRSSDNKVVFTAHNPTDDPTQNVEIVAKFNSAGLSVMTRDPGGEPMPVEPRWPDIQDDFAWRRNLANAGITRMAAAVPAIAGSRIKMRRDGDVLEIAYLVGDLRAHGSLSTHPITIVPSMNYQSEQLDITVSATAMDRRGKEERQFVLPLDPEFGWPLDHIIDPKY